MLYKDQCIKKNIRIHLVPTNNMQNDDQITTSQIKFQTLFDTLLSNCTKYSTSSSTIYIHIKKVTHLNSLKIPVNFYKVEMFNSADREHLQNFNSTFLQNLNNSSSSEKIQSGNLGNDSEAPISSNA